MSSMDSPAAYWVPLPACLQPIVSADRDALSASLFTSAMDSSTVDGALTTAFQSLSLWSTRICDDGTVLFKQIGGPLVTTASSLPQIPPHVLRHDCDIGAGKSFQVNREIITGLDKELFGIASSTGRRPRRDQRGIRSDRSLAWKTGDPQTKRFHRATLQFP